MELLARNHSHMIREWPIKLQDHDRGPIVARSWCDRGLIFEAKSTQQTANSGPIHRAIEAMFHAHRIAPSTLQIRAHEPLHHPRPSGQFSSLKACISLICSSTFDRLVKKLSEFRGRSLVHRVPPAFRLDCEAIGAGLITNFSLISSNFPLEFRTSTRKNPSKFASIHENWSPILAAIGLVERFDRLS